MRPRCSCRIRFCPKAKCFTPQGLKADSLEAIELTPEEVEALRLKNIKNLDQIEAAKAMGISQSSFQRILSSAYKKVSEALIKGKVIKLT